MLIRLLAFALNAPANNDRGALEFAKDMLGQRRTALWAKDLTGQIAALDRGRPTGGRRLLQASFPSRRVKRLQLQLEHVPNGGTALATGSADP